MPTHHRLVDGKAQCNLGLRALPFPAMILLLGTATSVGIWQLLRHSQYVEYTEEFDGDANALAFQLSSHIERVVAEKYVASFIQYGGEKANNIDSWTNFTNKWLKRHGEDGGDLMWCPRVQSGNTAGFYGAARTAYPDYPGGIEIFEVSVSTLEKVYKEQEMGEKCEDIWPVLYVNPFLQDIVGFDIKSEPDRMRAIELMLESNGTVISPVTLSKSTGLPPRLSIVQPVFKDCQVVGLVWKSMAMQLFYLDILEKNDLSQHFLGADTALFLRKRNRGNDYWLLFDRRTEYGALSRSRLPTAQEEIITPEMVRNRGSHSFSSEVSLTNDDAILLVASFEPNKTSHESQVILFCGCAASLLVALLVYGRQLAVLKYKFKMERATVTSNFKSRFVADMSHEFRTPLNGIIGTAELLADEQLSSDATEMVYTLRACSNILLDIINDALDICKIDLGQLRVEASLSLLRRTLMEVMEIMQSTYRSPDDEKTADIILRLELKESIPTARVLADVIRIRQVLVNLVSNAFRFTNSGSVTVTARCEPYPWQTEALSVSSIVTSAAPNSVFATPATTYPPSLILAAQQSVSATSQGSSEVARGKGLMWWVTAPWRLRRPLKKKREDDQSIFFQSVGVLKHEPAFFCVEVTDSGTGMTPKQIGQLFEPFPKEGPSVGGIGLSLAISKSLCESMGGTLGCKSEVGKGSTFFFSVLVGVPTGGGIAGEGDVVAGDSRSSDDARSTEGAELPEDEPPPSSLTRQWNLAMKKGRDNKVVDDPLLKRQQK